MIKINPAHVVCAPLKLLVILDIKNIRFQKQENEQKPKWGVINSPQIINELKMSSVLVNIGFTF